MNNRISIWNVISWIVGVAIFAVGVVNLFWGNDPWAGFFIVLASLIYFLNLDALVRKITGRVIPGVVYGTAKVLLAIIIFIAALGVGELFDKIDLMMAYFRNN